jgi:hypothetical protein
MREGAGMPENRRLGGRQESQERRLPVAFLAAPASGAVKRPWIPSGTGGRDSTNGESLPEAVDDEETISEALQMLKVLDNTPPGQMSPLFYQHWFEQLNMVTRDLLRILGHDPDA